MTQTRKSGVSLNRNATVYITHLVLKKAEFSTVQHYCNACPSLGDIEFLCRTAPPQCVPKTWRQWKFPEHNWRLNVMHTAVQETVEFRVNPANITPLGRNVHHSQAASGISLDYNATEKYITIQATAENSLSTPLQCTSKFDSAPFGLTHDATEKYTPVPTTVDFHRMPQKNVHHSPTAEFQSNATVPQIKKN